jgi:hypothetical protein
MYLASLIDLEMACVIFQENNNPLLLVFQGLLPLGVMALLVYFSRDPSNRQRFYAQVDPCPVQLEESTSFCALVLYSHLLLFCVPL